MKSLPVLQDEATPRPPGHRSLWQSVEELDPLGVWVQSYFTGSGSMTLQWMPRG